MKLRTMFPDVDEADQEALGVALVDVQRETETAAAASGLREFTGENRRARLKGVATWEPPVEPGMPTRRDLLQQRKRRARGKLDVQTRRLARAALRKD